MSDKTEFPFPPDVEWDELKPFWDGTREKKLRFPKCRDCGHFQWYPQPMCPKCQGMNIDWADVRPQGTIYTYTVVRRPFLPGFEDRLPIIIALVEFDDAAGPRLVTNLIDCSEDDVEIGARVEVAFTQVTKDATLPFVRLASS